MRGLLQSYLFERWYEELCRIKIETLQEIVSSNKSRLMPRSLPKKGGLYAFWWTGNNSIFRSPKYNRELTLKGPAGKLVTLIVDDTWLGIGADLPVPLYVGKSAADISKRIGQHLRLSSERMFPLGTSSRKRKAPTTLCQLRAGIEHMFHKERNTRDLILDNIGLSYVELGGDGNSANRFYLEDFAIGRMKPAINVDIER